MKSIKHELIITTVILVLVPVIITNIIYSYYFSSKIKTNIVDNNKKLSSTIADGVNNFIDKAYGITEEMAQNKTTTDFNSQHQKEMLIRGVSNNSYFDLLYIQNSEGNQTARSSGELASRANRWWFKKVINDKKSFVSKSYYSVSSKCPVTAIFHPILSNDSKIQGVFGADIKLDDLQKLVEKYTKDKSCYGFIIDNEGVVIAHPDKVKVSESYNYITLKKSTLTKDSSDNIVLDESGNPKVQVEDIKVPQKLKEISEKALKGESGIAEYIDNDGKKIMSSYMPINLPGQSDRWSVITVQDKACAMSVIKSTQIKNVLISTILIIVIVILIYILSGRFTKPISDLKDLMEKASEGNLAVKAQNSSKNEIGVLCRSFNIMVESIRKLIVNITEATNLVGESCNSLVSTTEETAKSIEEVTNNISEVAMSSEKQASIAAVGLENTTKLSDEIINMTSYMNEGKDSANNVYNVSNKGMEVINTLENVTSENNKAVKNVVKVIESLKEKANAIGNIADTITAISEQTNLLALNAAIEAARAGEAGKGFSVVADEVRKLSENTADSSNDVKEIVSNVQRDINTAINAIHQTELSVSKQNDAVSFTKNTFNEILNDIEDVVNKIMTASSRLDSVNVSKNELLSVMDKVSNVAGDLAASSEQVSAITQEQNAAVEEISTLSEELNKMAEKLEGSIKIFQLQ